MKRLSSAVSEVPDDPWTDAFPAVPAKTDVVPATAEVLATDSRTPRNRRNRPGILMLLPLRFSFADMLLDQEGFDGKQALCYCRQYSLTHVSMKQRCYKTLGEFLDHQILDLYIHPVRGGYCGWICGWICRWVWA